MEFRDWRGTPVTVGCHILYGVRWYTNLYMVEARVEKIHPRLTDDGPFPFHLYVIPIRRTDDETRYAPRARWGRRIESTDRITVIPATTAGDFVNWHNELRGGDDEDLPYSESDNM